MSKRKVEDPAPTSSKKLRGNKERASEENEPTYFAEASTEGLGSFHVLPAEILEELCSYLNPNDILNMTLTSKAMNRVISTDPQIMKRIELELPNCDMQDGPPSDFFGHRVYPTVNYNYHRADESAKFREYMKAIGHSVKEIDFGNCGISYTAAVGVLKLLPNIKSVIDFPPYRGFTKQKNLDAKIIEDELRSDPKPLKLPLLESLSIESAGKELSIFAHASKLAKLVIKRVYGPVQETRCIRFLQSHANVNYLKVSDLQHLRELGDPLFNLKKLVVESGAFDENDKNFVINHRDTLQSFTGCNISFLEALQDFSKLKEIKLTLSDDSSRFEQSTFECPLMKSVEKLDVSFGSYHEYQYRNDSYQRVTVYMKLPSLDPFPRLKEFNARKFSNDLPWAHSGIEKISLEKCSFPDLVMPNLKSAKFISIDFASQTVSDYDNILEITLENCSNAEAWITSVITSPVSKLRKLELINMEISEYCQYLIEQNQRDILLLSSNDPNEYYL